MSARKKTSKQTRKPWTAADIDKLIAMRDSGNTNVEIAKAMGRNTSSVAGKASELIKSGKLKKAKKGRKAKPKQPDMYFEPKEPVTDMSQYVTMDYHEKTVGQEKSKAKVAAAVSVAVCFAAVIGAFLL